MGDFKTFREGLDRVFTVSDLESRVQLAQFNPLFRPLTMLKPSILSWQIIHDHILQKHMQTPMVRQIQIRLTSLTCSAYLVAYPLIGILRIIPSCFPSDEDTFACVT